MCERGPCGRFHGIHISRERVGREMRKAGREAGAKRKTEGFDRGGEHREVLLVGQKNAGRRPAVRKAGLAFGERGGGDDAGAFFYCDDLIAGDIFELIGLAAGPADFDGVGFSVIAEAEGENEFAGREVAAAAGQCLRVVFDSAVQY